MAGRIRIPIGFSTVAISQLATEIRMVTLAARKGGKVKLSHQKWKPWFTMSSPFIVPCLSSLGFPTNTP